jgi:Tetratricopeptide repeat
MVPKIKPVCPRDAAMNSNANQSLLAMAKNLRRLGQHELALPIYRRYLDLEPNHVEALLDLGGLLFELNAPDEGSEVYERAIKADPLRPDLRLAYARHLLENRRLDQAAAVLSAPLPQPPTRKGCLVRHTQLFLRRMSGGSIQTMEALVRIGDLVALMICAEYMKKYENRRIVFQLIDKTHISMKAEVLFKDTIDEILTENVPNFGFGNPDGPEVYDPGSLWIASTFYHERYGGRVVPTLCLDPSQYRGPEMDWGRYAVFSPLFDPPYNRARGMEEAFVNEFCERLHGALGERAIVITNQPERIHSKIRTITSSDLYDLTFLIGRSKAYIGGDTGFTHLAAAGRVRHLFALYGANYSTDFVTATADLCSTDQIFAFAAPGKYWGGGWDSRPKCDPAETSLHFHLLQNNGLPGAEMDSLVGRIKEALNES